MAFFYGCCQHYLYWLQRRSLGILSHKVDEGIDIDNFDGDWSSVKKTGPYVQWIIKADINSPRKLYVQKGGKMDMASLMGSIKDRTSKEFLEMQSFQLEKTWVCLS